MSGAFGKRWSEYITQYPVRFIILGVMVSLLFAWGGKNLFMSNDYRYFFGADNPHRLAFEGLQATYSKDDSVLFVVAPSDGVVFKEQTLKAVRALTKRGWKLPFATRVDSISNFQYSSAQEDDLYVRDLIGKKELEENGLSPQRLEELKKIALNEPLLKNKLINEKASVVAINVRMAFPGKSVFEVPKAAAAVRELAEKIEREFKGHKIRLSGIVMLNNAFNEAGKKDMMTLTPLMYLIIVGVMLLLLKNIVGVFVAFVVIFLSIICGMGFSGWAAIPITPPSAIAPIIIMTLAIADSIHILKSIIIALGDGMAKREAIIEGFRINFRPVFLTSFTTAIGFLSLNLSDTPPFHDLGNITAVGVVMAFFFSIVLLPGLLMVLPFKVKLKSENELSGEKKTWYSTLSSSFDIHRFASKYSLFIQKRSQLIIVLTVIITGFLAFQIPKIELNDQFVQYFDESVEFRKDSDFITKHLSGIYQIDYDLKSTGSQGINDPFFLQKVDDFAVFLRSIPKVIHVNSFTDTLKRLNKNMHGDDPTYYHLPKKREMAAQYLLLYEMSLPYGLDLNNQIDLDKSSTRISVTLDDVSSAEMLHINQLAREWLLKNTPKYMHTLGSSPAIMFSHITKRNVIAMAWATLLAIFLIAIIMIVSLKSVEYGLISLLPNIIPASLAFGLWSLFVGKAGFAIAVVGSVTLGIVVDDTVHFLTKYAMAKDEKNFSAGEAIEYAFKNVGAALIFTSIILVLGFSVLIFSSFKMNFILGVLSSLTIFLALAVDFTFLPALLYIIDRKKRNVGSGMKNLGRAAIWACFLVGIGYFLLGGKALMANSLVPETVKNMTPEQKGLWVAQELDKSVKGFVNQTARSKMILKNKAGKESVREMRVKTLEVAGDGDKSLTIFDTPRDVKGTIFLSFSHAKKDDDQWLFLPALKRVKRISSSNKSGPFMGSEFAYEDISSQEIYKYTYKYIRPEKVLGHPGHVIVRRPVMENSGYTRQMVWIDGSKWRVGKIDFYDRKDALLKTLTFKEYHKYKNGKWRAHRMEMVNHQTGKGTTLLWSEIKFKRQLTARDFDKAALKRIR